MTRGEAIATIEDMWMEMCMLHCTSAAEQDRWLATKRNALMALGVTEEELGR